jgi:hypothetical protein
MLKSGADGRSSAVAMRDLISSAAFLVKVSARMRRRSMPCPTRLTKRPARVVVLPEPGPARTSWMFLVPVAAFRCSGSRVFTAMVVPSKTSPLPFEPIENRRSSGAMMSRSDFFDVLACGQPPAAQGARAPPTPGTGPAGPPGWLPRRAKSRAPLVGAEGATAQMRPAGAPDDVAGTQCLDLLQRPWLSGRPVCSAAAPLQARPSGAALCQLSATFHPNAYPYTNCGAVVAGQL